MPTVESLQVAFQNSVSAGAQAAASDLDKLADASERVGQSTETTDQKIQGALSSATALANRYDGAATSATRAASATDRYNNTLAAINLRVQQGDITWQQAGQYIERAGIEYQQALAKAEAAGQKVEARFGSAKESSDKLADSTGQTSTAMRMFGVQASQAISGLATGQPIWQVAIQQGHQMYDVLAAQGGGWSTLGSIAKSVFGFLASGPGVILAVGAALGTMAYEAEGADRALSAMQTQLRATRTDAASMADAATAAAKAFTGMSGESLGNSLTAAQTLASQPTASASDLTGLLQLSEQVAKIWNTDLSDAAKRVAGAMQDPLAAITQLAQQGFPGATAAAVELTKRLTDQGNLLGAQNEVLSVYRQGTLGAEENTTRLGSAVRDLNKAWNDGRDGADSFATEVGRAITTMAAAVVDAIASILDKLDEFVTWVHAHGTIGAGVGIAAGGAAGAAVGAGLGSIVPFVGTGVGALGGAAVGAGLATLGLSTGSGAGGVYMGPTISGSSERAVGMFQILPSTAADLGVNPYDYDQNIRGGLTYLNNLYGKYGIDKALSIYGGYGTNVSDAQGYIGKIANFDVNSLPADTQSAIAAWGKALGMSDDMIKVGMAVAGVESGGYQYSDKHTQAANTQAIDQAQFAQDQRNLITGDKDSAGTIAAQNQSLEDQITRLTADQKLVAEGSVQWQAYQQAIDAARASINRNDIELQYSTDALSKLNPNYGKLVDNIDQSIRANDNLTEAYHSGQDAVDGATAWNQALAAAVSLYPKNAVAAGEAAVELFDKYKKAQAGAADLKLAEDTLKNNDQIEFLQEETATIGMDSDARTILLAHMQAEIQVREEANPALKAEKQAYLDSVDAMTAARIEYQRQENAIDELAGSVQSAFSTIGDDIAQAFVQGQSAAVTWGNISKAVIEQVIQEALKLAVLNPLLNSLFGKDYTTLGNVIGALGTVSSNSGSSSGSSLLNDASSAFSIGNFLYGDSTLLNALGITGTNSLVSSLGLSGTGSLWQSLGLTGSNGLLSNLGLSGLGSSTAGILNTTLLGGSPIYSNGIIIGQSGGLTLGAGLSGFGLGMGAGSLLNSIAGGNSLGGTIGSGVGAAAGAVIGSVIPGIGTVLGGLLGGSGGGLLGGLFGPGKPHHGWNIDVNTDANGLLQIGNSAFDKFDGSQLMQQAQSDVAALDQILQQFGVQATATRTLIGGRNGVSQPGSIAELLPSLSFTSSSDSELAAALQGRSFGSASDLQAFLTFYTQTYEALLKQGNAEGSLQQSIDQINDSFGAAITTAQQYGLAIDGLTDAQQKQIDAAKTAAAQNLAVTKATLDQELAQLQGNGTAYDSATLELFDANAAQQRQQMSDQLLGVYGDAYKSTSDYVQIMDELNDVLALQRDQTAQATQDNAAGQLTGTVTSLTDYVNSLKVGSSSPLSPQDQLAEALSQFDAVSGAAAAGDATSFAEVQSYATAYLNAASDVYGSGTEYVQAFQHVMDQLQSVANTSPDNLIASTIKQTSQSQTDTLVSEMETLRDEVTEVRRELQQLGAKAV